MGLMSFCRDIFLYIRRGCHTACLSVGKPRAAMTPITAAAGDLEPVLLNNVGRSFNKNRSRLAQTGRGFLAVAQQDHAGQGKGCRVTRGSGLSGLAGENASEA